MKLVAWMTSGSVLSAFIVTLPAGAQATTEIWLGMIGPLAVASCGWIVIERSYRRSPESLTRVRAGLFLGKMIAVGGYVIAILGATSLRRVPFVVSFTGYFFALYLAEAIALHRLLQHPKSRNAGFKSESRANVDQVTTKKR